MGSQPHARIAFVYSTLMKKHETQSSQVEPSERDLHEGKSTSFVKTSALTIYSIKICVICLSSAATINQVLMYSFALFN